MTLTVIVILCLMPIAWDVWLALREFDQRRAPMDRWWPRRGESVASIEETF